MPHIVTPLFNAAKNGDFSLLCDMLAHNKYTRDQKSLNELLRGFSGHLMTRTEKICASSDCTGINNSESLYQIRFEIWQCHKNLSDKTSFDYMQISMTLISFALSYFEENKLTFALSLFEKAKKMAELAVDEHLDRERFLAQINNFVPIIKNQITTLKDMGEESKSDSDPHDAIKDLTKLFDLESVNTNLLPQRVDELIHSPEQCQKELILAIQSQQYSFISAIFCHPKFNQNYLDPLLFAFAKYEMDFLHNHKLETKDDLIKILKCLKGIQNTNKDIALLHSTCLYRIGNIYSSQQNSSKALIFFNDAISILNPFMDILRQDEDSISIKCYLFEIRQCIYRNQKKMAPSIKDNSIQSLSEFLAEGIQPNLLTSASPQSKRVIHKARVSSTGFYSASSSARGSVDHYDYDYELAKALSLSLSDNINNNHCAAAAGYETRMKENEERLITLNFS